MGIFTRLLKKQAARGQHLFEASISTIPEEELIARLQWPNFEGVIRLDPSRAPAIQAFLARVANRDFKALAEDLERGTVDPDAWFYPAGWTGPRPVDNRRHFHAIVAELARRAGT